MIEVEFKPTEIWTPGLEDYGEAIENARREINSKDPNQLIHDLREEIERASNGVVFAVLQGENPQEYSDTDALLLFNPAANAATDNMLVRAEFVRLGAKFADIRDANGKLKTVVMVASPSWKGGAPGTSLNLSQNDRKQIKSGELGPYAREVLQAVSEKEIGDVALFGFSQGADIALAAARVAQSANLDAWRVSVGDPTQVENRNRLKLATDFAQSGTLKDTVEAGAMPVQKIALGAGYGAKDFLTAFTPSMLTNPLNRDLWQGMSANTFESQLQEIIDGGQIDTLFVGYGSQSAITKPRIIEPQLQRLHELDAPGILTSIKIESGKHTWGDNLLLLTKLYLRALK